MKSLGSNFCQINY